MWLMMLVFPRLVAEKDASILDSSKSQVKMSDLIMCVCCAWTRERERERDRGEERKCYIVETDKDPRPHDSAKPLCHLRLKPNVAICNNGKRRLRLVLRWWPRERKKFKTKSMDNEKSMSIASNTNMGKLVFVQGVLCLIFVSDYCEENVTLKWKK